jgi:hypothetical protein
MWLLGLLLLSDCGGRGTPAKSAVEERGQSHSETRSSWPERELTAREKEVATFQKGLETHFRKLKYEPRLVSEAPNAGCAKSELEALCTSQLAEAGEELDLLSMAQVGSVSSELESAY